MLPCCSRDASIAGSYGDMFVRKVVEVFTDKQPINHTTD